tara:strand:+ start:2487 stop:3218 length:732 start_codon:yes stop_codon:yes gene_type:complete
LYSRVLRHIKPKDLRETISLRFTDILNPVFWIGDSLKPEVNEKLMRFAEAFAAYVDLDERAIVDVLLLGGNAGYNYTQYSDLDVHIVVDPKFIPDCNPDLLDRYYMDKKTLWELTHNVTILGSKAEPYIEKPGVTRKKSQGVWSIMKKSWIQKPTPVEGDVDEKEIEKKVNNFINQINSLIKASDAEGLKKLVKKLRDSRGTSLQKYGEYGFENMVFKELRNQGYIDKIRTVVVNLKSQSLSL